MPNRRFRPGLEKRHRQASLRCRQILARLVGDRGFHLAHDMHLARLAVKAQGEFFAAIDELQRLGPDQALHAGDALGLFGAQA